jgi:exosortase
VPSDAERKVALRAAASSAWVAAPALILTAFAFRGLAGFDPGRQLSHEVGPLFVPSDTAPGFVYGLIAFILYMRHRQILRALRARVAPSPLGLLLLAPAALLFGWAQHSGARDLELLALVPWLLGLALLLGGTMLLRLVALPVLLLLFAFPMPAVIANEVVWMFQTGTARLSTAVLNAIGVTALLEGDMIYARGYVFEVIETCSGLRITETLLLSAFAYGQILCSVRSHQIALVLLAPLLGFALNTARVLMIVFTPGSYVADDHTVQGLVVIVLGVFALAGIDRLLHRLPIGASARRSRSPLGAPGSARWAWLAAGLASVLCVGSLVVPAWEWTHGRPPWDVALPLSIDGWKGKSVKDDTTFLGSVAYVRSLHREYTRGDDTVTVFVAMDDRLQRDRSALSPKHELPGAGWQAIERRIRTVPGVASPVVETLATSRGRHALVWKWYTGAGSLGRETWRQVAALDNSYLRRDDELRVYRLTTPLAAGESREEAEQRLGLFAGYLGED